MHRLKLIVFPALLFISGCYDWDISSFDDADSSDCECREGICCDGCHFLGTETRCDTDPVSADEYRCAEDSCGADVLRRGIYRHCSGVSAECPTNVLREGDWAVFQACTQQQRCVFVDGTPLCHTCFDGCVDGHCLETQCDSGPCCDDGHFLSSDTRCSAVAEDWECRCTDGGCGADVECRTRNRLCTGLSAECTEGHLEWDDWGITESCSSDQICDGTGNLVGCLDCAGGCEHGECTEQAECDSGPCCDGGSFRPASHVCSTTTEYRCDGTGCGAEAQERTVTRHCSGASSACSGEIYDGSWVTIESCDVASLCSSTADGASCQRCPYGCMQDLDGTNGFCAVPEPEEGADPGSLCSCDSDCRSVDGHRGVCWGGICTILPDGSCPDQGGEDGCGPGLYCYTSTVIEGGAVVDICWTHCSSDFSCATEYEADCYCYSKPSSNVYCDSSCATHCY